MAGELMRIGLPCDSLAPVLARRHLATLPSLGWLLGDALLVATELVTNAVRHSSCRRDDVLVVSVSRTGGHVKVSVSDPGRSGGAARIGDQGELAAGLGLRIVEQLAARWGSCRRESGYEVWAELPLDEHGCGSHEDDADCAAGQGRPRHHLPDTYSYSQ